MISNYLKIGLRNLWKSKGHTFINVTGMSVAFCISVFLFLTGYLQVTYDSFHKDIDRVYQAYIFSNNPDGAEKNGHMPMPLAPSLRAEYPELEAVTRIHRGRKSLVTYKGKYFDENICMTDEDFFKVFSFPMLKGDPETSLNGLDKIVISEKMASAVFGEEEPIGKQIEVGSNGEEKQYIVSGVISNSPDNSTIKYDALMRIENVSGYQEQKSNWTSYSHHVFLKLSENVDPGSFNERLRSFASKYLPGQLEDLKKNGAKPDKEGDILALRAQKLTDAHFDTEISGSRGVPVAIVYTLFGIALFILFIACINFINLSIAKSFIRAKEVGVRKSLGAMKSQLFAQIWGESAIICSIAFLAGFILSVILLPEFNATFNANITLASLLQPGFLLLLAAVFVIVSFVAGGYPALKLSGFNTVEVLKGKISFKGSKGLRNSLIITQFTMSTLLICCTVIAYQQINYLRTVPVGFEKEQVISIPVGNVVNGQQVLKRLRNELASDTDILSITGTGVNLGMGQDRVTSRSVVGFKYKGKDMSSDWLLVDYDYLKTLGMKLTAGREFNPAYASDTLNSVIITESMAKQLGEKDLINKEFKDESEEGSKAYRIIGVIPDFDLYASSSERKPVTMHLSPSENIYYIFLRVSPQSLNTSMEKLEKIWKKVAPQSAFMGSFLDENVNGWYKDEQKMSEIFTLAAFVAVLLSCMGLFAVALIVVEQRTKEIGIRKVLGATVPSLLVNLSKDFIVLIIVALLIASPLAWFGMQSWLNNYNDKIEISVWVFVLVGLASLSIALLTISFQAIKAALMNPVKSLKSE